MEEGVAAEWKAFSKTSAPRGWGEQIKGSTDENFSSFQGPLAIEFSDQEKYFTENQPVKGQFGIG